MMQALGQMSTTRACAIMACWPGEGDCGDGGVVDLVAEAVGHMSWMIAGSHDAQSITDLVTDGGGVSGRGG